MASHVRCKEDLHQILPLEPSGVKVMAKAVCSGEQGEKLLRGTMGKEETRIGCSLS